MMYSFDGKFRNNYIFKMKQIDKYERYERELTRNGANFSLNAYSPL
jgi:hypothetical protein